MSEPIASAIQVAKIAAELNSQWQAKLDQAVAAELERCLEIFRDETEKLCESLIQGVPLDLPDFNAAVIRRIKDGAK